ncbi:MAG TPA: DUF58 domain-containing protein [Desulfatiglandales bacterium]|nr:DUF58 domain-containing protein [Desulfatiglandales bacterium]
MEPQEYRVSSIFIVPLIVFFVGVLLFIALLHGQRDLTIFAILILGVVTGARLWSRYGLSGIRCYSAVDRDKVFPGERLSLTVRVENAKFLPVWLQMTVPVASPLHPGSDEAAFTEESGLLWYQKARFEWDLVAQRRGVHRVGPPYIKAADIFGFFPRQREEHESLHVIVYPRLVPLRPISLPRRDLFGVPGSKSPVQDPVYILGTRDYQQWRPARYIHWKASARHNRLQEKVFEPSEQEKVLLAVEVSHFAKNNAEEGFEHTLEVVASLAVRLDQRGFAVGLVTNGAVDGGGPTIVPIARNPGQLPAILEALARLHMEAKWDLIAMLRDTFKLSWGVSCVHFSYEEDAKTQHTEGYLLNRKVPTVRVVCRSGPASGAYKRTGRGKIYHLYEIRIGKAEGR